MDKALLRNDDDDDSNATEEEQRIFFSSSFTLLQKTTPDRERGLLACLCGLSGGGVFDSDDFDAFFYPILWGKKWVFLERDIIQR